jgi:hypothetical protein
MIRSRFLVRDLGHVDQNDKMRISVVFEKKFQGCSHLFADAAVSGPEREKQKKDFFGIIFEAVASTGARSRRN